MDEASRLRAVVEVLVALALPAVAVVVLHGLGEHPRLRIEWSALELWLQVSPLEDVVAAILRLLGLTVAYWLLLSTAVYLLARMTRLPALIGAVEWATLPVVRRAADRAVALALVGSSFAGPAAPALAVDADDLPGVPPPPVVQVDGPPTPGADDAAGQHLYEPVPAGDAETPTTSQEHATPAPERLPSAPSAGAPNTADRLGPGGPPAGATPAEARGAPDRPALGERGDVAASDGGAVVAQRYEVVAGDNLWAIACSALTKAWGRTPTAAETAVYWRELIARNAARLRSANPDLIYPGEVLDLPAIPAEAADG